MVTSYIDRVNFFFFLNIAYLGHSWILVNTDVPLVWSSCLWNTPPFMCWKTTLETCLGLVLCFILLNVIVVQSPSSVRLFVIPWTASLQASLSLIISWNLPMFMFIASVMSSRHLILWYPLLICSYQLTKILALQLQH